MTALVEVAHTHPQEIYEYLPTAFIQVGRSLECIYEALARMPPGFLMKTLDQYAEIVQAIAECAVQHEEAGTNNDGLNRAVQHMFEMERLGIKNVLKAMHLVNPERQGVFRQYAERLGGQS